MHNLVRLALIASFGFVIGHSAQGQINCGTPILSPLEKSELATALSQTHKNLRRSSYAISVNAVIVQPDLDQSSFGNDEINQLMNRLNAYFKEIGLSFYLRNGFVQHVHSSKYLDFKTEDELELRKQYDRTDAVNLYFVKSISRPDGTILNGYSNLPTFNAGSNRLMFSYQDNNLEDFTTLRDKTLLHEFGHYFGLLHTFQDSNSEDVGKRELVTRGSSANCGYTGDELCDTPSDPYERLRSVSIYNCIDPYPSDLLDASGEPYFSSFDNIMSYHLRCGDRFTEQQYQRMEASLAIRLSPNAEYQISIPDPNFVAIKPLDKKIYCTGETVTLFLDKSGLFKNENTFSIEMSNAQGESFRSIAASVYPDSIQVIIPSGLPQGFNYRFKVSASAPETSSFATESIQVNNEGEIKLSTTEKFINLGDYAELKVKMEGTGPWNFSLSNGSQFSNVLSPELSVLVSPNTKTKYSITGASNLCQTRVDTSSIEVDVVQPNITISNEFPSAICRSELIRLPVSGLSLSSLGKYQIELRNEENVYAVSPTLSPLSLNFSLPKEIPGDRAYSMRIIGEGLGDYSLPRRITLKESPAQPEIISPLSYCFDATADELTADGFNLKWYFEETDVLHQPKITPDTKREGTHYYYVSQTLQNGCESNKSKIEVSVKDEVSATISGSKTIVTGDSTLISINLTGDAPWNIQLLNGFEFTSFTPLVSFYAKPLESTAYQIKQVNNSCGSGSVYGEVNIEVRLPLGNEESTSESLKVFPIPAQTYIDIESNLFKTGMVSLRLTNILGLDIAKDLIDLSQEKNRWRLPNLPSGLYLIHLSHEDTSLTKKILVK